MSRACKLGAVLALFSAHAVAATTVLVQYTLTPLGGNLYRYVYTITNNGSLPGGVPIRSFDIYFDSALYQSGSFNIVTPPSLQAQWSEVVFPAFLGVPAAYDVLSISGPGILAGATVSGFAVEFRWLGSGVPGAQPFEIFEPGTFLSLQTGNTFSPTGVPTLSAWSMILLSMGLAGVAAREARARMLAACRCPK